MKKKTIFLGIVMFIIITIIIYFGVKQMYYPNNSNLYKIVTYPSIDSIKYSDVIKPDYNEFKPNHLYAKWKGGNIDGEFNLFYKNLNLLPFYVNQLGVDINDFNILAGDGENMPYGCHLSPKYCIEKPNQYTDTIYLDDNGCPHYKTYIKIRDCRCGPGGDKVCAPETDLSLYNQWNDCSEYKVDKEDVGGTTSGTTKIDYKNKLKDGGFEWNSEYVCWKALTPSDTIMDEISKKMSCRVYGELEDGESYELYGEVSWAKQNGFKCTVSPISGKIKTGYVLFNFEAPLEKEITVYRLENNKCNLIEILESEKTRDDYDTLEECQNHISQESEEPSIDDVPIEPPIINDTKKVDVIKKSLYNINNILFILTIISVLILIIFIYIRFLK